MSEIKLVPTEYDGGVYVAINGRILPIDGVGMDPDEAFSLRYSIKNTSPGHWAVFYSNCRLDRTVDCFVYGGMPSSRDDSYVDNTTWATAEEAAAFLAEWRVRETARCEAEGFLRFGEVREKKIKTT